MKTFQSLGGQISVLKQWAEMLKYFNDDAELDDWTNFDEEETAIDNIDSFYNDVISLETSVSAVAAYYEHGIISHCSIMPLLTPPPRTHFCQRTSHYSPTTRARL